MKESPVILFDGVCNLCNGVVQFVIRHDPKELFKFAPLQSDFARARQAWLTKPKRLPDSIILIEADKVFSKSTAALRIAMRLSGGWKLLYGLIIIPKFLRDWIYDWVARNRYHWFGQRASCMVPGKGLANRFLG